MNKINHVCLLLALVFGIVSACKKDIVFNENNLAFEIAVPVEWDYTSEIDDEIRYYAWSPLSEDDVDPGQIDSIREDVVVTREYYTNISLEDYYTTVLQDLTLEIDYDSLSSEDLMVNGYECKKHVHLQTGYITDPEDPEEYFAVQLKMIRYVFYRDDYGYIISCAATPETYDQYLSIFEYVLSTFKFKD